MLPCVMAAPPVITIDLAQPPRRRWEPIFAWGGRIGGLLAAAGGPSMAALAAREDVMQVVQRLIAADHFAEFQGLSAATGVDLRALLLGNGTYDLVKFGIGCSAFAVDAPGGPLHGRNLDWYAPDNVLALETLVCRFVNAPAGPFTTIGWPGFIGALSGCAPGRFSITLNAAFSADPPVPRQPVALLLRRVFEEERSFADAVARLSREPISTDCLILVAGMRAGEMAVIERTPSRQAVRGPRNGAIHVTNDYVALSPDAARGPASEIRQTSCGRFQRLQELLAHGHPKSGDAARRLLAGPEVQMIITVQRMVFSAALGTCEAEAVVQDWTGQRPL
jgi:acid ceramidase